MPAPVFLLFTDSAAIAEVFRSHLPDGWELEHLEDRDDLDERREKLARADAMLHADVALGGEELAHATRLKLIQRQGVGYDNLDVESAAARGIAVCLCPIGTPEAVAEHTIMLMLGAGRHLPAVQREVAAGAWPKWAYRDRSIGLQGTAVTLVGFGRIGQAVAERLLVFGAQVTAVHRPSRPIDPAWGARGVRTTDDLDGVLADTTILSLHCPLTPATRGLIDRRRLAALPDGAVLVNTARGELVDEEALRDALASGGLAGAGLDVLAEEPPPADHPLRTLPNVLLTPHLAAGVRAVQHRKAEVVMDNARAVLDGREPRFRLT